MSAPNDVTLQCVRCSNWRVTGIPYNDMHALEAAQRALGEHVLREHATLEDAVAAASTDDPLVIHVALALPTDWVHELGDKQLDTVNEMIRVAKVAMRRVFFDAIDPDRRP